MCFSAKASFVASATLAVIGCLSIKKARKHHSNALTLFASTPLLFSLQQLCEGFVWLSLTHKLPYYMYATNVCCFIFFAGIVWPMWSPLSLYSLETIKTRKRLLAITVVIGILTASLYLLGLITQPIQAIINHHHIYYPVLSYPFNSINTIALFIESIMPGIYFTSTVLPLFLSSIPLIWLLGIVQAVACLTSQIFFPSATASVWCFFAAIASILIYIMVKKYKKQKGTS